MTGLSGEDVEAFGSALTSAFTARELEVLVRTRLDRNLAEFIRATDPYPQQVHDLILAAERGHWIPALLLAAVRKNPGNPELGAFAESYFADLGSGLPPVPPAAELLPGAEPVERPPLPHRRIFRAGPVLAGLLAGIGIGWAASPRSVVTPGPPDGPDSGRSVDPGPTPDGPRPWQPTDREAWLCALHQFSTDAGDRPAQVPDAVKKWLGDHAGGRGSELDEDDGTRHGRRVLAGGPLGKSVRPATVRVAVSGNAWLGAAVAVRRTASGEVTQIGPTRQEGSWHSSVVFHLPASREGDQWFLAVSAYFRKGDRVPASDLEWRGRLFLQFFDPLPWDEAMVQFNKAKGTKGNERPGLMDGAMTVLRQSIKAIDAGSPDWARAHVEWGQGLKQLADEPQGGVWNKYVRHRLLTEAKESYEVALKKLPAGDPSKDRWESELAVIHLELKKLPD